jgi:hypothetical protein
MELDFKTQGLAGSELCFVSGSHEGFLIAFISECLESLREREKRFVNVRCLLLWNGGLVRGSPVRIDFRLAAVSALVKDSAVLEWSWI